MARSDQSGQSDKLLPGIWWMHEDSVLRQVPVKIIGYGEGSKQRTWFEYQLYHSRVDCTFILHALPSPSHQWQCQSKSGTLTTSRREKRSPMSLSSS